MQPHLGIVTGNGGEGVGSVATMSAEGVGVGCFSTSATRVPIMGEAGSGEAAIICSDDISQRSGASKHLVAFDC